MQGTDPLKSRTGSFTKPEALSRSISQASVKKEAPKPDDQEQTRGDNQTPANTEKAMAEVAEEQGDLSEKTPSKDEMSRKLREYADEIVAALDADITVDDLHNYLFKGTITKQVSIIPGLSKGTFRTLSVTQLAEIDERMADIRNQGKKTTQGLANEEALITLSYAWVSFGDKPLGRTPEQREAVIRHMGVMLIERAAQAWQDFCTLLRIRLKEEGVVKK